MLNKVIKIEDETFEYRLDKDGIPCETCHFCDAPNCPDDVCSQYDDGYAFHYLLKIDEPKTLVSTFNEAAEIKPEKTYTRSQIIAAHVDWHGSFNSDAIGFADHLEKFSDPEYQEFMRLKEKFNG